MTTSIATLRTLARQRADMENSLFVGVTELDRLLQDSYSELYDLLVNKHQDYFMAEPVAFTLTSSTYRTALAADFYRLLGVDVNDGAWRELDPFNWNERNDSNISTSRGRCPSVKYRVLGNYLTVVPNDGAAGSYRYWYIPTCPDVVTVGSLDAISDKWRDYVVVDAAIKCLIKEESDITALMAVKSSLIKRIEESAASRDAGRSSRITDVYRGGNDF